MTSDLFSEDKIFKYLVIGLTVIGVFILVNYFFLNPNPPSLINLPAAPLKEIKIDPQLLESPLLENLSPFDKILPPQNIGRENPFEPF